MIVEQGLGSPEFQDPSKSGFVEKLEPRWQQGNFVCVGLDTDFFQISDIDFGVAKSRIDHQMFLFNISIVDETQNLVCAYKLNSAFYEAQGEQGQRALIRTIRYIKANYPDVPVILDAKRADIGNTNNGYVQSAFDKLGADAITVNPYLSGGALDPFFEREHNGVLVIARTSNPDAGEFQDLPIDVRQLPHSYKEKFGDLRELAEIVDSNIVPLYQIVAYKAARYWNKNGNVGVVVGATYPEELAQVRKIVGDILILIPGIGAQGGEVEATVKAGRDSRGQGMIINSSRGIIFASKEEDFAQVARAKTEILNGEINRYRVHG